jgi:hypothetical protein
MAAYLDRQPAAVLSDVEQPAISAPVADAASAAEAALADALDFTAARLALVNRQAVIEQLEARDAQTFQYMNYGLARQVAQTLGMMDQTVRTVYLFDEDAMPEAFILGRRPLALSLHLIAWVERKTQALGALIQALDRSLVAACQIVLDSDDLEHVLDVQLVDDGDVQKRIGYAALITSLHNLPMRIWQRAR